MKKKLLRTYNLLYSHFGPQHWWPGETAFEVVVGAILTQSASWNNVEIAIANLKKEKTLFPKALHKIKIARLQKLIRSSGYFRAKAKKVKAFVRHLMDNYNGSLKRMFNKPILELRQELLAIYGIGPETADSIILYAANKPTFVVDAYTRRIGHRLGLFKFDKYDEIKAYFEGNLSPDRELFNEFHALIVALGKYYCKPRPVCGECPVKKQCNSVSSRV